MKGLAIPVVTAAVVCVVMCFQAATPKTVVCEAPEAKLGELQGFTSEPLPPSESELSILPADTRIEKRLYTAPDGHWYQVTVVVGGVSKSSIHRPELCLPAQGFLMTAPRTMEAGGVVWRTLTLDGGVERPSLGFAYTFYNQEGYRTASHTARIFRDVWDRSVLNRIDRWVMVTVNTSRVDSAGVSSFLARLKGFLK